MPNWCLNKLTISHSDPAAITRFVNAYNESKVCQEFLPLPEGEDWYGWQIENWGTKWDVGAGDNEKHGLKATVVHGEVCCSFDSAWSPPIGLYNELVLQGYRVLASYIEPGMGYCGVWEDGEDLYTEYGNDKGLIPVQVYEDFNIGEWEMA